MQTEREPIKTLKSWLSEAGAVTVLTGAGISTDSGIPDYRGPSGVWTRNPSAQRLSTISAYLNDPDVRRTAWQNRRDHPAWKAVPNAAHRALADLERAGRLRAILTQNVDGLHQRAGNTPERVLELHGSLYEASCVGCGDRRAMSAVLERVARGEDDPACEDCGGILKSAVVLFGEPLSATVLEAARQAVLDCDLFLVVGTSLMVAPASAFPELAARAGARVVILNAEPTPSDPLADLVVRQPVGSVLPAVVAPVVSG